MKYKHEFNKSLTKEQTSELFALALGFTQQFVDEQKEVHPEVDEFFEFIKANRPIKTQSGAIEYVTQVHNKLAEITDGKDVDGNALLLAVNAILYAYEDGYFKGSKGLKALRVCNIIYFKMEKLIGNTKEFKNTNRLMGQLDVYNQKEAKCLA